MSSKGKSGTYLLITFLAVIWGSSFILMKRGLVVYSPYQVGAIRMFSAFLCLFPFVWNNFRRVPRGKWKYIAASGLLANGIPSVLFPVAQLGITSSLAGMINTLTPVFTLVIGALFFGMAVTKNRLIGLVLGLGGALLLIAARGASPIYGKVIFSLIVVVATICYAISVNILRHRLHEIDSLSLSGFALMFVGPPAALYLFSSDFLDRTAHVQGAAGSLSAILALGVLSTAVSTFLFNNLIKSAGALAASSVTYLIPIVAVLWGFIDNEPFSAYYPLGLGMVLGGVYLINKR